MMRRLAIVAFCAVALSSLPARAQTDRLPNLITVTGEGEVAIVPDLAILSGGVAITAKTAREASDANAKMMTAVMAELRAAGIPGQDVQTSRISLHPVRDNTRNDSRITGFQAVNQVTVKVRDVAKTADVIDRLAAMGATDISGIQFVVSSPSKPLDQARQAAMADARRKAEVYAKVANVRLGPAFSITEEGGVAPGPITLRAAPPAATPISVGEQTQRISVTVSYELVR